MLVAMVRSFMAWASNRVIFSVLETALRIRARHTPSVKIRFELLKVALQVSRPEQIAEPAPLGISVNIKVVVEGYHMFDAQTRGSLGD